MSAQAAVAEHRQHLIQLRFLADAELFALLAAVKGLTVAETRNVLIAAVPELIAPYISASGELAAVLFEDLRSEAGRRGTFYAEVATPLPNAEKLDSTVRWAVGPLADDALEATVFTRMSGALSSMVMNASRDTIVTNGDREQVGFQRMPRPGCCAFCGMLASRGADYSTSRAAGGRIRYERDGKSWIGTASHDGCHCTVVPVYSGTEMAELADATQKRFEQMYLSALKSDDGEGSTKSMLASWRKANGTH